jgi:hypothetical protein
MVEAQTDGPLPMHLTSVLATPDSADEGLH